jgi:Mce-associated membrane protein
MPLGKAQRALQAETVEEQAAPEADEATIDETTPDESAAAVQLTSSAIEEPTVEPRRRWNFLGGRKNQPEVAATEEVVTAEPADGETTESGEAVTEDEPVLVPHQPAGKRLKIAAAAVATLFVAGGAFAGATVQPVLADRALVDTKLDIARTAMNAITTLWTYTPENMDSLADRSARYLSGDFAFQYRKFIDSIVATNKQAQVTNSTSVLGTAVETVTPSEATAVVYTNSVATSPVSKNIPSLRYLSYRLEMKRDRADWRITRMTTITSLDLTPQL